MNLKNLRTTFLVFAALAIYISGLFLDVINVDSAQYAAISMELLQQDNWLFFYERGEDYLDKPPMIFWSSALSYWLFGISPFTYKLTSFIFSILCIYSTYQLGKLFYDDEVGELSVLLLVFSVGFLYLNMDVKTDVILCGAVVSSVYWLAKYKEQRNFISLFLGAFFIGIALLTKGPLGLMVPVFSLIPELCYTKQVRKILDYKLLLAGLVVLMMLLPMSIGLYQQFDLHPEKVINGKTGVSGLKFYFWEQSFGRITGSNVWSNDTGYFYFVHTLFLFALPWVLAFILAYANKIRLLLARNRLKEIITISGFTLTLMALSLSQFKLPHYIFVAFPFVAIIAASEYKALTKNKTLFKCLNFFSFLISIVFFLAFLFCIYSFPLPNSVLIFLYIILWGFILYLSFKHRFDELSPILLPSFCFVAVGLMVNTHLMPNLLDLQSEPHVAALIKERKLDEKQVFFYDRSTRRLEFDIKNRISNISLEGIKDKIGKGEKVWVYMSSDGRKQILKEGIVIDQEYAFEHLDLNRISIKIFLESRKDLLEKRFFLQL